MQEARVDCVSLFVSIASGSCQWQVSFLAYSIFLAPWTKCMPPHSDRGLTSHHKAQHGHDSLLSSFLAANKSNVHEHSSTSYEGGLLMVAYNNCCWGMITSLAPMFVLHYATACRSLSLIIIMTSNDSRSSSMLTWCVRLHAFSFINDGLKQCIMC